MRSWHLRPPSITAERPTVRQLEEAFYLEEERVISSDWVVSYKTRLLQLERLGQTDRAKARTANWPLSTATEDFASLKSLANP
jgi:hypothetical protein